MTEFRKQCLCDKRCGIDATESERDQLRARVAELESGIHPAKKPMEGGFSMDQFMAGVSPEDAAALADALEEAEQHESEFDSGITESQLMDRLKEALDQRDEYREALQKVIEAKDATAAYMARIPDGCSAEPSFLGRLVRREAAAEDAARTLLSR